MLTRFGKFELDSRRYELTCAGRVVKLERIPMKLLFFLTESKGSLVSREAIAEHLWGKDVFVDAQHSVNTAINKLRTALRDDLADPSFIQTVKGMGYRFIAEVEVCIREASAVEAQLATLTPSNGSRPETAAVDSGQETTVIMTATDFAANETIPAKLTPDRLTESSDPRQSVVSLAAPIPGNRSAALSGTAVPEVRARILKLAVPVLLVTLLAGGGLYYRLHRSKPLTDEDTIVLADFANSTGDAVFDDTLKTALNVSLEQSPFLNLLPDNQVAKTLQLMARPADAKLTPELTRELCQRVGSKAYLAGAIGSLGSEYVLGLKAVNCQSGDRLAEEQVTAASKEKVLDALGRAASKLRTELGESLVTVQKFDVLLEQATTSSLEALKVYSKGYRGKVPIAEQISYFQRAIELDPNFAMGYESVGVCYSDLGEFVRAREYFTKAFQLRERTSEREKLVITSNYYDFVTGELDKAAQAAQQEMESYPRDTYGLLGSVYSEQGQYEKAAEMARQSIRLVPVVPSVANSYGNLANFYLALQRFDEARKIIHEAQARKIDVLPFHPALYALAFVGADSAAMAEQQQRFNGKPAFENFGLALASDTEAYGGHLAKARDLTQRAVDSAIRADDKENGAIWQAIGAQREAAYGNVPEARRAAAEALKLDPASPGVESEAALAFAMAGDTARVESLSLDLGKLLPLNTQMQSLWLPAIQAQLAIDRKNPRVAIDSLRSSSPIELGQILFVLNISCLYPTYVRGEAYLAAGQGSAAASEFQKILDHSGIVWNCWTGTLAHLGVARANALESRTSQVQSADADAARTRALTAYKDFLTLWKDADPNIPILKEANAEYAKLQ